MTTSRNGLRAFLAVSALLASVSAGSQQLHGFPPENSTTSSISWLPCTSELNLPEFLQCAKYSVPIDWESPHGEHFDLGLVKLPAAASNSTIPKVGTLFAIPGGPGGPASDVVTQIALGIKSEAFLSSFDVIGLDPRGVGRSNQIQCNTSIQTERVSMYPQNEEELERMRDKNKRFGESCWELTGSLLEHVDTIR
jgi:pimeloyl-ACP methyl ester carboxylesterase